GLQRCHAGRRRQPARAVVARLPVGAVDAFGPNPLAAPRRMDEATVADVDADMRVPGVAGVVEHEVARLELAPRDRLAELRLLVGSARELHAPCALEDMRDQPAAVETGLGRMAAVAVMRPQRDLRV